MSLFGGIFEEEESDRAVATVANHPSAGKSPPPPRLLNGLCGIYNQGATCYLNSLLQTLLLTPEFRESLFQLGQNELGCLEDKDKPSSRVRVIPIQLQRLFARLLLLNQQAASTDELTDSFGWTNCEEMQQHDVQELNRILFSAIEDSLIGTAGGDLIKRLYHGCVVNQIICQVCGKVSERQEDFLDICVTVAGTNSLQLGLEDSYVVMETMDGKNQYRCESCNKLVDAKKGAKIRHLPPILTLSLLRFSFDFVKLERYKETGKFEFPTELDMAPYCENAQTAGETEYELFSVVIHSGSTHGGHYHAYIRDVDALGQWTHPDDEEIVLPMDPTTGKVDYIEFDSPVELIHAMLIQQGEHGSPVDRLCAELVKQTGVSWNKRFKGKYGAFNKFLKKHDDKFIFNQASNWVSLLDPSSFKLGGSPSSTETNHVKQSTSHRPKTPPPPGHCWFDFDDSRVRPITERQIETQFLGKESAYMLFYRRKSMRRPPDAEGDRSYGIPFEFIQEVLDENQKLDAERLEYENKINRLDLEIHFSSSYEFHAGALQPIPGVLPHIDIVIDRRSPVSELLTQIFEVGGYLVPEPLVVHIAKDLPAGLHLYDKISGEENSSIMSTAVTNGCKLFVWDGTEVNGHKVQIGAACEPVYLTIVYGNPDQVSHGFPKDMTIWHLKLFIAEISGINLDFMNLSRMVTKGVETHLLKVTNEQEGMTLGELNVSDGDQFIIEDKVKSGVELAKMTVAKQTQKLQLIVENRCEDCIDGAWPLGPVHVETDVSVGELKVLILSQLNIKNVDGGGRLRLDDDNTGICPPFHEELSLKEAGLKQGNRIVLEPGTAPQSNQITLTFTHADVRREVPLMEAIVERTMTVEECMMIMLTKAGFHGLDWHLRRTNWCGEAAAILDDPDMTLEQAQLRDGNHILIEEGQLPPKGFVKLSVWLLQPVSGQLSDDNSSLSFITSGIQNLFRSLEEGGGDSSMMSISDIIISKDATIEDLKQQLLTLPIISDLPIPTTQFIRVRVLENKKPTLVLRGLTQTVQRSKLQSGSHIGLQVLTQEEDLNPNQVLLSLQQRVVDTRSYFPAEEFIWDISKGCTASALRYAISQRMDIPMNRLTVAKHVTDRYEWMVIEDMQQKHSKNAKGKKKGGNKGNLRHAPYHLKDGDTIAVKDSAYDPNNTDDFCTIEDDLGKEMLAKEAEEKKRKREEMRRQNASFEFCGSSQERRPEVGIKIHVGDFR